MVLNAQGFASNTKPNSQRKKSNSNWQQMKPALLNMRALQLDAINTIIRTHYMPLYSRLGNYDRDILDKHLFDPALQSSSKRKFFEYWGHECSVMPIEDYPLLFWRMQNAREHKGLYKQCINLAVNRPAFIKQIKSAIASNGPLASRDLEGEGTKRGPGMWQWSETKQALEYLFWTGEITTRGRNRFERLYDLTENTIPNNILDKCSAAVKDRQAALDELMLNSVRALGLGTEQDIRDYFRLSAKDASASITRLLQAGLIEAVSIENWEKPAYWIPGTRVSRSVFAPTLLSPFDPLIWHRPRLERLFDFTYRIEIYVPADKRQYGYYVLPFLYGNRMVCRLDLKSDRQTGLLRVLGMWWEPDVQGSEFDAAESALLDELNKFARWLGLDSVDYTTLKNRKKTKKITPKKVIS